ncbi:MAG: ribonuclease III [Thermoanaerobaculia bacterium]
MIGRRRPKTELEKALSYRFRDRELLELALTHRSHANERGLPDHNERLEFLGDAVLGAVAAAWLYSAHPELPEGELSKRKGYLVSEPALARLAAELEIGRKLRLGVGEERSGGRRKPSLQANAVEALLGAVFLDGGLEPVRRIVTPFLAQVTEEGPPVLHSEPKTRLQEELQARGWELPVYRLVAEEGPDHAKRFTVECRVQGRPAGRGTGRSKKTAEREAAARALEALYENRV